KPVLFYAGAIIHRYIVKNIPIILVVIDDFPKHFLIDNSWINFNKSTIFAVFFPVCINGTFADYFIHIDRMNLFFLSSQRVKNDFFFSRLILSEQYMV